jgi:hypothetical protein
VDRGRAERPPWTPLDDLGFIPWFGKEVGPAVSGPGWVSAFSILALV